MSSVQRNLLVAIILGCLTPLASSQWLKYPTPGIPRTKDGKPDLLASGPRMIDGKADLSGIWGLGGRPPDVRDIPLTAQARASVERFQASQNNKNTNLAQCLPHFMTSLVPISLYKIIHSLNILTLRFLKDSLSLLCVCFLAYELRITLFFTSHYFTNLACLAPLCAGPTATERRESRVMTPG